MRYKSDTLYHWKRRGLIITSQEEFEYIYWRRENSTHCEKCGKKYKSTQDRNMDHEHLIHDKYGAFRNILCTSCNLKRSKIRPNNTSGYSGICKNGYYWEFRVNINGKKTHVKASRDKEWLIKFATQWKIDNNYDN